MKVTFYQVAVRWGRNRSTPLLAALVLLFAVHPLFIAADGSETTGFPALLGLMPLLGIFCVGTPRQVAWLVGSALVLFILAGILYRFSEVSITRSPLMFGFSAYFLVAIAMIGSRVSRAQALLDDRVIGGLSIYMLAIIFFSGLHHHASAVEPTGYQSNGVPILLHWNDSLYFSTITMATIGFGDITPVGKWPRAITMMEGIIGVILLVLFIGRLAALPRASGHGGK